MRQVTPSGVGDAVYGTVREIEEGAITLEQPREQRRQRRLYVRICAPRSAYGTEVDTAGVGWYALEHEPQLRREVVPWSLAAARTRRCRYLHHG
jgi:hypothetical protein